MKKLFQYDPSLLAEVAIHQHLQSHPNVVRLHSANLDLERNLYLYLEYCDSDLQKFLDGGAGDILVTFYEGALAFIRLSSFFIHGLGKLYLACQDWIPQMLRGMAYLHKYNIIHRDMKPGRIELSVLKRRDVSHYKETSC